MSLYSYQAGRASGLHALSIVPALALCLLLVLCAVWAHLASRPPVAPPATQAIAAQEFSAARALQHVQQIAQKPHPIGSPELLRVRQYLLQQLQGLGLQPQLQSGISADKNGVANVHNIFARLPGKNGPAPGRALLLLAHYDSAPQGPGAGDDGASVAAILEVLRALRAGPALNNDVLVLLTDGEEVGMLGADLFVKQHPALRQIGLVLNFDHRGNRGPLLMFETSPGNARLLPGLQQAMQSSEAGRRLQANSLLYEVYRLMPNYTDFTAFKQAGIAGMNFAAIEGHLHYHTAIDTWDRLSPDTLQQQGQVMLSTVQYFAGQDLQSAQFKAGAADHVYFNLPGWGLLHYAANWLLPGAALVLLLLNLFVARRMGALRWRHGLLATVLHLGGIALLTGGGWLVWQAVLWLHPQYLSLAHGSLYHQDWYFIALLALLLAGFAGLQKYYLRWCAALELNLAAALIWCIALFAVQFGLSGASYLFQWPVLALLLVLPVCHFFAPRMQAFCLSLAAAVALIFWYPLLNMMYIALTPAAPAPVLMLWALLLCLISPCLHWLHISLAVENGVQKTLDLPLWLSLPLGLVCLAAGSLSAGYDAARPRHTHLAYFYDSVNDEAIWFSRDADLDHWNRGFFPANAKRDLVPMLSRNPRDLLWISPAPGKLSPPLLQVMSDKTLGQGKSARREIVLRLASTRQARQMRLHLSGGELFSVQVAGHVYRAPLTMPWRLRLSGLDSEGIQITINMVAASKLDVNLLDLNDGLPQHGQPARPADLIVEPFDDSDTTQAGTILHL